MLPTSRTRDQEANVHYRPRNETMSGVMQVPATQMIRTPLVCGVPRETRPCSGSTYAAGAFLPRDDQRERFRGPGATANNVFVKFRPLRLSHSDGRAIGTLVSCPPQPQNLSPSKRAMVGQTKQWAIICGRTIEPQHQTQ